MKIEKITRSFCYFKKKKIKLTIKKELISQKKRSSEALQKTCSLILSTSDRVPQQKIK